MQNSVVYDYHGESDSGRKQKIKSLEIRAPGSTQIRTLRLFTLKAPVWQAFIPVAIVVFSVNEANSGC